MYEWAAEHERENDLRIDGAVGPGTIVGGKREGCVCGDGVSLRVVGARDEGELLVQNGGAMQATLHTEVGQTEGVAVCAVECDVAAVDGEAGFFEARGRRDRHRNNGGATSWDGDFALAKGEVGTGGEELIGEKGSVDGVRVERVARGCNDVAKRVGDGLATSILDSEVGRADEVVGIVK